METVNKFSRRFERKYGEGAVQMFKRIAEDPDNSLSDIARHFGFSKQYAWHVYQKISECPYSEVLKRKRQIREQKRLDSWKKSESFGLLMKVKERMAALGLSCDIVRKGSGYLFIANDHKLVVKFTDRSRVIGSKCKEYFHVCSPKGPINDDYDFLVGLCISKDESAYYVIPRDVMPKDGVSLIPRAELDESKYARFKEAWDLLLKDENSS